MTSLLVVWIVVSVGVFVWLRHSVAEDNRKRPPEERNDTGIGMHLLASPMIAVVIIIPVGAILLAITGKL